MNIQRFKWPAIMAACLHGALFLSGVNSTPDAVTRPPRPKPETTICDFPVVAIEEPDPEPTGSGPAGGGSALPELPDSPAELPDRAVFTVPVSKTVVAFDNLRTLPAHVGLPGGEGWGPGNGPTFVDASKLDGDPRAKVQPAPDYPARMRMDGIGGSVTVEFDVNTEGRVVRAEAVSFTHREFVEPAVRAVRHWRFEPGRRNNRVVPFRLVVPIEFGLDRD